MVWHSSLKNEYESETTACYYPSDNMRSSYLSSSSNQRATSKTKQSSKLMQFVVPIVCGVVVIAIIVAILVAVIEHATSSDASLSSSGGDGNSSSSLLSSSCSRVDPKDRTGVTHLVFGFALVTEGIIVPTFQSFSDDNILQCVKKLHERCIYSLASVGGSTNNENVTEIANATLFAESAVALLTKFGFDGLDLDNETVGAQFSANRTVGLLRATREALDAAGETLALLTYDAYFTEGDNSVCAREDAAAYSRCFPTEVLEYVDWVNVMAYNINEDKDTAAAVYAAAVNTTFAAWDTQLGGNFSLATIGLCVKRGCAYGPGPDATVIAEWEEFARQNGHGGMMIYAASAEVAEDFPVTRSIISTT